MIYFGFHLVFIVPVIAVLAWMVGRRPVAFRRPILGVAVLCIIAMIYTTPWDDYLISRGIWSHQAGRTVGWTVGRIPVEEFVFFILQPILTGLFLLHFAAVRREAVRGWIHAPWRRGLAPVVGVATCVLVFGGGALLSWSLGQNFTYLFLILAWAGPVVAFQWAIGGTILWSGRRFLLTCLIGPTVYLWVVDMIAIELGIWTIAGETSTGLLLLSLPMEEAVFFLVTNLMVIQGLILYFRLVGERRTDHAEPAG